MAEMLTSGRLSRAPSVSSTGTATSSVNYSFVPRYIPKPEPAYISASSAAEFVTHRHRHESYDLLSPAASPTNDGAVFTPSSLNLLNAFLDSILYNFIAKARGTSLNQLRPAILEVLKARLGRDALATAEEELHGLVDDHESDCDDTIDFPHRPSSVAPDWHLESAFKRMRLRVMVFIRLGDFEDEDEYRFLEEDENGSSHSHDFGLQSTPLYLATVLEYLAELALALAGDAAYARSQSRARRTIAEDGPLDTSQVENVIVEDKDVEKIALNSSLGRLWRTWLKSYKSTLPAGPASPGRSRYDRRDSFASASRSINDVRTSFRKDSGASMTIAEESQEASRTHSRAQREVHGGPEEIPDCEPSETEIAANIPLPINERDVDEIEVPGLADVVYDDDEERDEDVLEPEVRRRSSSFALSAESQRASDPRLRSSSVPSANRLPWDWIPASVRKALKRQAELDREVELAASIPLPEDSDESQAEASESAEGEEMDIEDAPVATAAERSASGIFAGAVALSAAAGSAVAATAAALMGRAREDSLTGQIETADERASSPDPSEQFYDIPNEDDAEVQPTEQVSPTDEELQAADEGRRSTESDDTVVPTAGEVEEHQKDLESSKDVASPRDSTLIEATDGSVDSEDDAQRAVSPPLHQHPAMIAQRVQNVNATQQRNGPPKPLPATAANPYAMLYDDDVEPELIGVARTSNVPIHSTTPSISAEQRPWTPNRGVPSVMRNGTATPERSIPERSSLNDRAKAAPSPLRSIGRESISDATAVREVPRSTSQDTERPVNPERYTKYVTVKESPTIPRFYTSGPAPLHTPTEARPPSGNQSVHSGRDMRHSPKGSLGSTGTRDRVKTEEEARFDALLATKEPVKYTLTPEEIRDPAPWHVKPGLDRKAPGSIDTTRMPGKAPGSKSSPVVRRSQQQPSSPRPMKISDIRKQISAISPEPIEPRSRKAGLLAREARISGSDINDFADWIRTTGPNAEQEVQPIALPHRWSQASSKGPMVPREPDGRTTTSGELIDFIRRGPPQSSSGDHRIPRTVAPFRSTMDSDDLGSLVNGASNDHSLVSRPSVTDSFRSNAPLIDNARPTPRSQPGSHAPQQPLKQKGRTQRRVRDPYAVDSDDEDDDFTALPPNQRGVAREPSMENVGDFLRATASGTSMGAAANGAQRATNGFAQHRALAANGASRANASSYGATAASATGGAVQPLSPRANGGPTTAAAGARSAGAAPAPRSSHPALLAGMRGRVGGGAGRLQARPAGATRGFGGLGYYQSTSDMADFLRSSGPEAEATAAAEAAAASSSSARGSRRHGDDAEEGGAVGGGVPRGVVSGGSNVKVERRSSKRRGIFWKRSVEAGA